MNKSDTIENLSKALSAAQAEFPPIPRNHTVHVKTRTGGSYEFTYTTLDHLIAAVMPTLTKHGLACLQPINCDAAGKVGVTTLLLHQSGEWLETHAEILPVCGADQKISPQDVGSAITYLRRYSLAAILGVCAEDDDDGNFASGNLATPQTSTTSSPRQGKHAQAKYPEKTCPRCQFTGAIRKSKLEGEPGYYCWTKLGGCGASGIDDAEFNTPQDVTPSEPPPIDVDAEFNQLLESGTF